MAREGLRIESDRPEFAATATPRAALAARRRFLRFDCRHGASGLPKIPLWSGGC